ncbi:MAG: tetratricopeptide repeat protein [Planctomycetota bacterium]
MVKRRIHRRNLIIFLTVAAAIALGGGALWLYLGNVDLRVRGYLESAREHEQNGMLEEAAIECKKALRLEKNNFEALVLLGSVEERLGKMREAAGEYARAGVIRPEALEEVLLPLARLQDRMGMYSELRSTTDSILKIAPDRAIGHVYRAHYLMSIRDGGAAVESLEKARRLDPERMETVLDLADVYMVTRDFAAAQKVLDDGEKRFGKQGRLVLRVARVAEMQKQAAEALQLYRAVRQMEGAEYPIRLEAAVATERLGQADEARKALEELIATFPAEDGARIALADLEVRQGEVDAAAKTLDGVGGKDAALTAEALVRLAEIDLGRRQYDRARERLNKLEEMVPGSPALQYLKGRLSLEQGDAERAQKLFEGVVAANPGHMLARYMLAMTYLRLREPGKALEQFKQIGDGLNDRPALVQGMARGLLEMGENDLAIERCRSFLVRREDAGVRLLLGTGLLSEDELEEAERQFESIRDVEGMRVQALTGLATVMLRRGKRAEAKDLLATAVKLDRDNMEVLILQAQIQYFEGDRDGARTAFDGLLGRFPRDLRLLLYHGQLFLDDPQANAGGKLDGFANDPASSPGQLRTIAGFYRNRGKVEDAVRIARLAWARDPKDIASIHLVFDLYMLDEQVEEAQKFVDSLGPGGEIDDFRQLAAARIAIVRGQYELAERELGSFLKKRPGDVDAQHFLGLTYLREGRTADAIRSFDKLLADHPKRVATQVLLAWAYEAEKEWHRALALAKDLLSNLPNDDRVIGIAARCQTALGQYEEALASYRRLYDLRPNVASYRVELAKALVIAGKAKEAEGLLEQWRTEAPTETAYVALLADARFAQGNGQGALQGVEEAYRSSGEDPQMGLILVGLHQRLGEAPKAQEALEKVVALAGDRPEILVAASRLCLGAGNARRAFELAGQAYQKKQDALGVALPYALTALAAGEVEAAGKVLEQLNVKHPSDAQVALHMGHLRMAQGRAADASEFYAKTARLDPSSANARYELARSYLVQGDAIAAEAELARAIVLDGTFEPARTLQLDVLRGNGKVDEAIVVAEAVLKDRPGTEPVFQKLCEMLIEKKRTGAAESRLADAETRFAEATWPYELAARLRSQNEEHDRAAAALERGLAKHPDTATLVGLLAQALVDGGKAQEGIARAKAFAEAHPGDMGAQLLPAGVLERARKIDEARGAYAQVVERFPDEPLAYVQLAAFEDRQGDTGKAVEAFRKGVERLPASVVLLMGLAQAHGTRNETQAANEAYRKILAINPDHVVAANNLAWNLAGEEGKLAEALALAKRASARAPGNPYILDTLGYIHLGLGDAAEAERIFRKVIQMEGRKQVFRYHLALALEKRGAIDEAMDTLKAALSSGAQFQSRDEAQALLERLQRQSQP